MASAEVYESTIVGREGTWYGWTCICRNGNGTYSHTRPIYTERAHAAEGAANHNTLSH